MPGSFARSIAAALNSVKPRLRAALMTSPTIGIDVALSSIALITPPAFCPGVRTIPSSVSVRTFGLTAAGAAFENSCEAFAPAAPPIPPMAAAFVRSFRSPGVISALLTAPIVAAPVTVFAPGINAVGASMATLPAMFPTGASSAITF